MLRGETDEYPHPCFGRVGKNLRPDHTLSAPPSRGRVARDDSGDDLHAQGRGRILERVLKRLADAASEEKALAVCAWPSKARSSAAECRRLLLVSVVASPRLHLDTG